MSGKMEIYKCDICGAVIEVLVGGSGQLLCCGESMKKMEEKKEDKGLEKHVPVIEEVEGGYKVKVGSVEHPMSEEHYIQFIELIADGKVLRSFLKPSGKPEAVFKTDASKVKAREYCNIHGLWSKEK